MWTLSKKSLGTSDVEEVHGPAVELSYRAIDDDINSEVKKGKLH